ncbi:MAG: phosphoribosylanthranilate isomerase [Acetobacteraceae bacterium]
MTEAARVQIKICGIREAAALDAAGAAGADFVGFVFFPPSPRWVTPTQAAQLASRVAPGVGTVGLFVDPTDAQVETALREVRLDALQVYAAAPRIAALRARFGLPVWRALGVGTASDLPTEAGGADRLVLEAKPAPGASRPGGNAVPFDWPLLRGWTPPSPWILAGGLTIATVNQAIRETGAIAVDVSSGVESAPGVKDAALIRAFVAAARA